MSVTRFHSLALGKYKNFNARTDGLISVGDTTPDVSIYSLLYADTAGDLNITYFDNPEEGQIVQLINLGAGEVEFSGAQMLVTSSSKLYANDNISFIHHNSSWYETGRSLCSTVDVKTLSVADATPSVAGVKTLIITSGQTIHNFDDGYTGQVLTVLNMGAAVTLSNSVTTIMHSRSGQAYILTTSDSTTYVNNADVWYNIGVGATAV